MTTLQRREGLKIEQDELIKHRFYKDAGKVILFIVSAIVIYFFVW